MIVFGIIMAVVGALCVTAFILSKVKCTVRTEATVSKIHEKKMVHRGRTTKQYIPVFSYEADGKTYTEEGDVETGNSERFTVGQKEFIFINPKNPKEFRYGNNVGILLFGMAFLLIGAFFIVLSVI